MHFQEQSEAEELWMSVLQSRVRRDHIVQIVERFWSVWDIRTERVQGERHIVCRKWYRT